MKNIFLPIFVIFSVLAVIAGFFWFCFWLFSGQPLSGQLNFIAKEIAVREEEWPSFALREEEKLERGEDSVFFTSVMDIGSEGAAPALVPPVPPAAGMPPPGSPRVRTIFNTKAETVEKRTVMQRGNDSFSFTVVLDHRGMSFRQTTLPGPLGDRQAYYRDTDVFLYSQGKTGDGDIHLKEWIYASQPNAGEQGSVYTWSFASGLDNYSLILKQKEDGSIGMYRKIKISGINETDVPKRQSVMEIVRRIFESKDITDEQLITSFDPLIYWTKDGVKKTGKFILADDHTLAVVIEEPLSAYPLLIDPSASYGQWLGGAAGNDYVTALAVNADEIYVGGYSDNFSAAFESVTWQGTHSSGYEGFVIEIADGTSPTLNWGQWLGGTGNDYVTSLAVNADEIYVGGYSDSSTSWESVTFQGAYSGNNEGFVIEIADGSAPTLNWAQWVGGTGSDSIDALAVNGDEIYAGGSSVSGTEGETITWQGSCYYDGFVVEIADGTTPTLNWGQWLGGDSASEGLTALAVNGDEIYAGGYNTYAANNWETVTWQGTHGGTSGNGYNDGWVIEIADGATPTLVWGQWLSGDSQYQSLRALAVNGDEIYAGGYTRAGADTFETVTWQGTQSGWEEGWVIEIADGATPTLVWGQWLGGSYIDYLLTLIVNGDEIYAGGYTLINNINSWETTLLGTATGWENFIAEIADGATPTINWIQLLGGSGNDYGTPLAVNGDEIYVGGYSTSAADWESVTFQGSHSVTEGFVIEIADGTTPTLVWGQWLGDTGGSTVIQAIAVNANEIYAGGYVSGEGWTESVTMQGAYSGNNEGFVIEIADGATPTLVWGQWLGGAGNDSVSSLVVTGDEIYAGGTAASSTDWETITWQGAHSGGDEGFVVEIADGAAPTLVWGQWLGGTGNDSVAALAVAGDEIYAGGTAASSTSWETISWQGDHSGNNEGFVVEIADGGTPTLNWGQWLGGTGNEYITSLAVTGDEVYAGGYGDTGITNWETVTFQGTFSGGGVETEGFVIEIADGTTPILVWGQWLGGTGNPYYELIYAIAVTGDEIYVGGASGGINNWETISWQGSLGGAKYEGFVIEIADGVTPTLNWGQWLGSDDTHDYVTDLAVNGDEIYAGGSTGTTANWESVTWQGTFAGNYVIEIADGATPVLNWGRYVGSSLGSLAVNGNEIYIGGYSTSNISNISFQGTHNGATEGFIVELLDDFAPFRVKGGWRIKGGWRMSI